MRQTNLSKGSEHLIRKHNFSSKEITTTHLVNANQIEYTGHVMWMWSVIVGRRELIDEWRIPYYVLHPLLSISDTDS